MKVKNLSYLAMLLVLTGQFSHASSNGKNSSARKEKPVSLVQSVSSSAAVAPPTGDQVKCTEEFREYVGGINQQRTTNTQSVVSAISQIASSDQKPTAEMVGNMITVFSSKFGESNQLMNEILGSLAKTHLEVERKKKEIEALSSEKEKLTQTGGEQDHKIAELDKQITNAKSEIEQLTKKIDDLTVEKKALTKKLEEMEKEKKGLSEKIQQLEAGSLTDKEEIGQLTKRIQSMTDEKNMLSQEKENEKKEWESVTSAAKDALKYVQDLQKDMFVLPE